MKIIDMELNRLKPYENNPRNNLNAVDAVANSIKEFGFKNPIVVDKNNTIINGHTRYQAAHKLGLTFVPVIVADDLTEEQIKAFRIMDNKSSEFADWDYEKLYDEIKDLSNIYSNLEAAVGFTEEELAEISKAYDDIDLDLDFNEGFEDRGLIDEFNADDLDDEEDEEDGNPYTNKINIPQYEIRGEKPELTELVKTAKTESLIAKINESNAPDDIKEFLIKASYRHLAFNYQKIAEFYAHADKEIQELMEQSALVIIDYDDAMKYGYLRIKNEVTNMVEEWGKRD